MMALVMEFLYNFNIQHAGMASYYIIYFTFHHSTNAESINQSNQNLLQRLKPVDGYQGNQNCLHDDIMTFSLLSHQGSQDWTENQRRDFLHFSRKEPCLLLLIKYWLGESRKPVRNFSLGLI